MAKQAAAKITGASAAGKGSPSGATSAPAGKAAAQVCKLPLWQVGRVACKGCSQPLPQLWVVFRARPPAASEKKDGGTEAQEDECIKNATESLLKELEASQHTTWSLGLTSDKGYLGPISFDAKKWEKLVTAVDKGTGQTDAKLSALLPKSFRFQPRQKYEFYFIQHPSRQVAERVLAELAAAESASKTPDGNPAIARAAEKYGAPLVMTPDPHGKFELEESPATFWPSRSFSRVEEQLYDGWCLFQGMPSGNCPKVKEQVLRLQIHLGALRYYVGDQVFPYVFHLQRKGDPSFNTMRCPANEADFDVRVMNAVYTFQQHEKACTPFKVSKSKIERTKADGTKVSEETYPHAELVEFDAAKKFPVRIDHARRVDPNDDLESEPNSWRYLRGEYVESSRAAATGKAPAASSPGDQKKQETAAAGAEQRRPVEPDGVVDGFTAEAIKRWLENGLRRPGEILVRYKGSWMRPDLAKGLYAWDQLAKALGCANGIQFGHTYRHVQHSGGGKGAALRSIHKVGLAADGSCHHYFPGTTGDWHVIYEDNPNDKLEGKHGWTVLGISDQVIPPAALTPSTPEATAIRETIEARLNAYTLEAAEPELVKYATKVRRNMIDKLGPDAAKKYFRIVAKPWFLDVASKVGGVSSTQEWAPEDCYDAGGKFIALYHYLLEAHRNKLSALQQEKKAEEAKPKKDEARIKGLDRDIAEQESARDEAQALIDGLQKPPKSAAKAPPTSHAASVQPEDSEVAADASPMRKTHASFLNLTALGAMANMSPIHNTGNMPRIDRTFESWDLLNIQQSIGAAITQRNEDLSQAMPNASVKVDAALRRLIQEQVSPLKVIVERMVDGTSVSIPFEFEVFDLDFMEAWPDLIGRMVELAATPPAEPGKPRPPPPDYLLVTSANSPQFTIQLSNSKQHEGDADKVANLLGEKGYAGRYFWVQLVPTVPGDSGEHLRTSEQWAAYLRALAKKLRDARTAVVDVPAGTQEPPRSQPVAKEGAPAPRLPELSRVSFQPVFVKAASLGPPSKVVPNQIPCMPDDRVTIQMPGSEQCQEWWHFQRSDMFRRMDLGADPKGPTPKVAVVKGVAMGEKDLVDGKWATLLAMIGFSRECLLKGPQPALHGRSGMGYKPDDLDRAAT